MDRDHEIRITIGPIHGTQIKLEATVDHMVIVDATVPRSVVDRAIELTLDSVKEYVMGKLGYYSTGL